MIKRDNLRWNCTTNQQTDKLIHMTKRAHSTTNTTNNLTQGPVRLHTALSNGSFWSAFTDILDRDSHSRQLLKDIHAKDGRSVVLFSDEIEIRCCLRKIRMIPDITSLLIKTVLCVLPTEANQMHKFPTDDCGWKTQTHVNVALNEWHSQLTSYPWEIVNREQPRPLWYTARETLDTVDEVAPALVAIFALAHGRGTLRYHHIGSSLIGIIIQALKNTAREEAKKMRGPQSLNHLGQRMHSFYTNFNEALEWCRSYHYNEPQICDDVKKRVKEIEKIVKVILFTSNVDPLPKYSNFEGKLPDANNYKIHVNAESVNYVSEILVENFFPAFHHSSSLPAFGNLPSDLIKKAEQVAKTHTMIQCETKKQIQYTFHESLIN